MLALPVVLVAVVWAVLPFTPMARGPALPILVALLLSAAIGFASAFSVHLRQRLATGRRPGQWEDGDFVGHVGVIQAGESALVSPLSGTRCPIYEYKVTRRVRRPNRDSDHEVTAVEGMAMAPTAVMGDGFAVRLVGFPAMSERWKWYEEDDHRRRLVEHLLGTTIHPNPGSLREVFEGLAERLGDEDGVLCHDQEGPDGFSLPNPDLEPPDADPPAVERVVGSMRQMGYRMQELVVPEGATVTAFGTYRARAGTLDVGSGTRSLVNGLFLGDARGRLSRRLVITALLLLVFGPAAGFVAWKLPAALWPSFSTSPHEGERVLPRDLLGVLSRERTSETWDRFERESDDRALGVLLRWGLNPNVPAPGHDTLLESALSQGNLERVALLLTSGANPDRLGQRGLRPLHLAVLRREPAAVAALLEAGAHPMLPDTSGRTALDLAIADGREEIVSMLRDPDVARRPEDADPGA